MRSPHRPAENPDVSVQILALGNSPFLSGCVSSLFHSIQDVSYEVLVLMNDARPGSGEELSRWAPALRFWSSDVNVGFAEGHNLLSRWACGEHLVLLNDDVEVQDGWLDALVETVRRRPRCGVVGSRVLWPDGRLQEAGSVLWADGSTLAIGDGAETADPRYLYERPVDYVSFASALVTREAWRRVGGLPTCYFPAYYEDVDFALAAERAGFEVWYQPASAVRHHRSQSSTDRFRNFLFNHNRDILRRRWAARLAHQPLAHPDDPAAVTAAASRPLDQGQHRILVIDDCVPEPARGSGYSRAKATLETLCSAGDAVSLFPTAGWVADPLTVGRFGVQVLDSRIGLEDHLRRGPAYDAVVISRPHNWASVTGHLRKYQPRARLVYDAEALWHARLETKLRLGMTSRERQAVSREHQRWSILEGSIGEAADHVVTISEEERAFFAARAGVSRVSLVAPKPTLIERPSPGPSGRSGLLFIAGWAAGSDSPNGDGLVWFVDRVLPTIASAIPWAQCLVTGAGVPVDLYSRRSALLRFLGHVDDLGSVCNGARAAVIPIRYGGGVCLKAVDAVEYLLPVVSTSVGVRGLPRSALGGVEVADDAQSFAASCIRLLSDDEYWQRCHEKVAAARSVWAALPTAQWTDVIERALAQPSQADADPAAAGAPLTGQHPRQW